MSIKELGSYAFLDKDELVGDNVYIYTPEYVSNSGIVAIGISQSEDHKTKECFLEIINVANKKRRMVRGFGGTIKSVSITYKGGLIAVVDSRNTLHLLSDNGNHLWRKKDKYVVKFAKISGIVETFIVLCRFYGRFYGDLYILNGKGSAIKEINTYGSIYQSTCSISKSGKYIAIGSGRPYEVILYGMYPNVYKKIYSHPIVDDGLFIRVEVSDNGYVVACIWDSNLKKYLGLIFDYFGGIVISKKEVIDVDITNDGDLIVFAKDDGLFAYDNTGELLWSFDRKVKTVQVAKDAKLILAGSGHEYTLFDKYGNIIHEFNISNLSYPKPLISPNGEFVTFIETNGSLKDDYRLIAYRVERKTIEIAQKPSIDFTLSKTSFKPNVWEKAKITIKNTNLVPVKNLKIEFDRAEYEIISAPSTVKPNESKEIECLLKFTEQGKVPLKIVLSYEDFEGQSYQDVKVITVNVGSIREIRKEERKIVTGFPEQLLSKYEPVELLGEGGFAYVWKCRRKEDGNIVAIKIPKPSEGAGESFVSELNDWKKLKHNNIVDLHDYNVFPYPYIEMELCDKTLKDCKFGIKELIKIAYAIADALSYAHSKGVVHGDLKPTNILLKDGAPKLSDWGMGYTAAYAPPEVLLGENPDEKADIWSFGVILYELVRGFNPFQGMDDIETMDKVLDSEPDFSNLGVFEGIIRRCLQKEKDKRFGSMDEIKKEVAKISITNYSKSFSVSKSKKDKVYSASEIVSTYAYEGNFKLARDRLSSVKKMNIMPVKIADAMLAVVDLMEKCNGVITLDYLKGKYKSILELLDEYRDEIENDENIGILIKKVILHQGEVISDDERELVKNVFCRALLEKIKIIAYRLAEI